MPNSDAARRIMEHLVGVRAPLVLISAPYGWRTASLVRDVETGLQSHFTPCPSDVVDGQPLQRRLTVLDETPGVTPYAAARRLLEPVNDSAPQMLVISNIELLDQDSSVVVDVLVRDQRVGLIMTCASESRLGFRYSRALQGPRGLRARVPTLTDEDTHALLTGALGAPPTSVLKDYLCTISAGAPQELLTAAQIGLDEGWIQTSGARSAILHGPAWADRHSNAAVFLGLRNDLGSAAVGILQSIAVQEKAPLRDFTEDPQNRDAVFWMVDAGLLVINKAHVHLNRPMLRHSLVLAPQRGQPSAQSSAAETASHVLHQVAHGEDPTEGATLAAAANHLEQGLLEQARLLAGKLPAGDHRRDAITASILVASGAPRSALNMLNTIADDPETVGLKAFVTGALLSSPEPDDKSLDDVCARLHIFDDYHPHRYLETFAAPSPPSALSGSAQPPCLIDTKVLTTCTRAALDSYAAAVAGQSTRAHSSWLIATKLPVAQLPIVAAGWVIERVGVAQILHPSGPDLYPRHWFRGETPERRLGYALTVQAQRMLKGLVCGEAADQLRSDMEDLWEQFEAGLPTGSVSRRFLEALDYALGGARSVELTGPPALVLPELTRTFRDATIDAVLLAAQLLHTPAPVLPGGVEDVFHRTTHTPGVRQTVLRCLILRRAAQLPPDLLDTIIDYGRRAQVKDQVLTAAAQLAGDQRTRQRVLSSPVPGVGGLRFCSGAQQGPTDPQSQMDATAAQLLSKRETQIVTHLLVGAGAADVARDLSISVRTVHTHVRNVYRKLGVGSRTQLRARLSAPRVPL